VELLIQEMEDQLRKARGETARSMAAVKQAERRIGELERQQEEWSARAASLPEGEEELARQVAARRGAIERDLAEARRERREAALDEGRRPEEQVAKDVDRRGRDADLDARLAELKRKLDK